MEEHLCTGNRSYSLGRTGMAWPRHTFASGHGSGCKLEWREVASFSLAGSDLRTESYKALVEGMVGHTADLEVKREEDSARSGREG